MEDVVVDYWTVGAAGLVNKTILFCWLFTIWDQCEKSWFINAQSRLATSMVEISMSRVTHFKFVLVPKATHQGKVQVFWADTASGHKPRLGSYREERKRTMSSTMRGH